MLKSHCLILAHVMFLLPNLYFQLRTFPYLRFVLFFIHKCDEKISFYYPVIRFYNKFKNISRNFFSIFSTLRYFPLFIIVLIPQSLSLQFFCFSQLKASFFRNFKKDISRIAGILRFQSSWTLLFQNRSSRAYYVLSTAESCIR